MLPNQNIERADDEWRSNLQQKTTGLGFNCRSNIHGNSSTAQPSREFKHISLELTPRPHHLFHHHFIGINASCLFDRLSSDQRLSIKLFCGSYVGGSSNVLRRGKLFLSGGAPMWSRNSLNYVLRVSRRHSPNSNWEEGGKKKNFTLAWATS